MRARETRSSMPTGWSWLCSCGWSTKRATDLTTVEHQRHGHRNWHQATGDAA